LLVTSCFFAVYSGGWTITGTAIDLRDPRILAVAQNHIMEAEYDDYSATNASTAAFCRSAALVVSPHRTHVFQFILAGAQKNIMHNRSCLFIKNICLPFCVQLMALLLLRHALTLTDEDDDDTSAMLSVSEITPLKMGC
jgi:hypothetical protein